MDQDGFQQFSILIVGVAIGLWLGAWTTSWRDKVIVEQDDLIKRYRRLNGLYIAENQRINRENTRLKRRLYRGFE